MGLLKLSEKCSKSYLKASFRNLRKDGLITVINLFGMATGLVASLIIFLYVTNELSYDKFSNAHRSYRLELGQISDQTPKWAITPQSWSVDYAERLTGLASYIFVNTYNPNTEVEVNGQKFYEDNLFRSNSNIIDLMDLEIIGSSASDLLTGPKKVILSEDHAIKYFGENDPVGKFITIQEKMGLL